MRKGLLQPNTKAYWKAVASNPPLFWMHAIPLAMVAVTYYVLFILKDD